MHTHHSSEHYNILCDDANAVAEMANVARLYTIHLDLWRALNSLHVNAVNFCFRFYATAHCQGNLFSSVLLATIWKGVRKHWNVICRGTRGLITFVNVLNFNLCARNRRQAALNWSSHFWNSFSRTHSYQNMYFHPLVRLTVPIYF